LEKKNHKLNLGTDTGDAADCPADYHPVDCRPADCPADYVVHMDVISVVVILS
jgi:hypothetical protein